ncbi:MAG: RsmB/NOP family class I SAM-dependent RNA methyltransferase [Lachnospiraceae bacterium]|nr:RsmB/NOP family class I SAM-dependent RNA methyltransferase [Lachnospiraceae bacterium]
MELPIAYQEAMRELLGEEYEAFTATMAMPNYNGLRVNTNKISCEEFEKICPFSIRPVPWIENGYYYDTLKDQPAKHPYYYAGLYYLQEPSAMTPANRLPVEPGDRVLDLCAAPGGKATELGAKCRGRGILYANDISRTRCRALLKNLELMGIGNLYVTNETPENLAQRFPEYFDKILIDAPCSGEGMFRREPAMIGHWEKQGPEFYHNLQKNIVVNAATMLKEGGMMLYSTCTFSKLENEGTINYLLNEVPELHPVPIKSYEGFASGLDGYGDCVRIFPHRMNGEGHFLALLQKGEKQDKAEPQDAENISALPPEAEEFFEHVKVRPGTAFRREKEHLVALWDHTAPERGLHYFRTGLYLGQIKKNRFEPSQALAMFLKKDEFDQIVDLKADDPRVIKYLKGETIETDSDQKGYHLICVDGYPLGWGKVVNHMIKNKYNPGWRWQ